MAGFPELGTLLIYVKPFPIPVCLNKLPAADISPTLFRQSNELSWPNIGSGLNRHTKKQAIRRLPVSC